MRKAVLTGVTTGDSSMRKLFILSAGQASLRLPR
jgi:hypothetical protein